jgi:hydrogenase/urease accessory protein HupE
MRRLPLLWLLLLLPGGVALADVFRPAYLEITELGDETYRVLWKVPAVGNGMRLSAYVKLPEGALDQGEHTRVMMAGSLNEHWQVTVPGGLEGRAVSIEGRAVGITDVIARYVRRDGSAQVERLSIDSPRFTVQRKADAASVSWSYFVLGVEHILGGIDHLLFVLALLLIVRGIRQVIATITAFTLAHSVTLAAATLGWLSVPGPPVEAVIALSIAFVAMEIIHARRGRFGLAYRAPWIVAFSFGLLHGFGFAGALSEVGLPPHAIPLALLMFNVGVEAGQLIFVVAFALVASAATRVLPRHVPGRMTTAAAYVIGAVACFWVIERTISFLPA